MVSTRSTIAAAALAVSAQVAQVRGHGYMLVPESQFKDSKTSAWLVQIDPTWPSDGWDGNKQGSVDTYNALAKENGVTDIRTLLDDTSKYGEDCGFTDPNGTPQDVPTDGKAVFSRGIVHVGPCEIWLDDTKVLSDDNCYDTYGGEDQDVKSVFPIDYSVCETTGCNMMRFYWLAFQGINDETVWQVYKNCIPLKGGSGASTSTTEETGGDSETTDAPSSNYEEVDNQGDDSEATDAPSSNYEEVDNQGDDSEATDAPSSNYEEVDNQGDESEATDAQSSNYEEVDNEGDDSETTDAPSSNYEEVDNEGDDSETTDAPSSNYEEVDNQGDDSEATDAPSSNYEEVDNQGDDSVPTSPSVNSTASSGIPDGTWPTSQGLVQYPEAYTVKSGEVFDGGMKTYERSDIQCEGQTESGSSTAVFLVEAGGTLKNVIIGANQMEGVHCDHHDCTIENVWWDDVCEDALSIKGGSATSVSNVIGGGARSADDKVVQHNGYGTVNIEGFYAQDFGKLYRSCGTCGDRQRFVNIKNVYAVNPSKSIVTVNENYGDEATLTNIQIKADDDGYDVCAWSQGNADGEPKELGAGIKNPLCQYTESDVHLL